MRKCFVSAQQKEDSYSISITAFDHCSETLGEPGESSLENLQRTCGTSESLLQIRANFRTIFRCARNIAAKIRRKCARLENSLRILERTFARFSKRFWGKFKRHDRNMNLLSVVPGWNTAEIYLQTSVYNQLDRLFYQTHLDILLGKQNCVLKIQRHCTSYCYSHDTRR